MQDDRSWWTASAQPISSQEVGQGGTKKSQLRQDQAQVVAGAAHHRMQRVVQGTLERIAPKTPIHLHVLDRPLDGTAPMNRHPERWVMPRLWPERRMCAPSICAPLSTIAVDSLHSARMLACSRVLASVWPSCRLPGMLRMPATRSSLKVVAMLPLTPNSQSVRPCLGDALDMGTCKAYGLFLSFAERGCAPCE